jgi:16S rRNA (guanine527-N7)-methyltransferase
MFHVKHELVDANVSRETLVEVEKQFADNKGKIGEYISKLLYWNKRVNLVSRDLSVADLNYHVIHSLMIQYSSVWRKEGLRVIDAGSGGGLPGIPLAMMTNNQIQLVDVVEKKMMACKDISRFLGLKNVSTKHSSIEYIDTPDSFVYVTKHAFKIRDFLSLTAGQNYSSAIFLKGDDYQSEISECEQPLRLDVIKLSDYHSDAFFNGKNVITLFNPNEKPGA